MSSHLLLVLLGVLPVTLMTGQAVPSTVFYLAMAVALVLLVQHRLATVSAAHISGTHASNDSYGWLTLWMAMPVVAVLWSGIWHGRVAGPGLESGIRYLAGTLLVVHALSRMPASRVRQVFWGYSAAAMAATAYIVSKSWPHWSRPDTSAIYNAVGYGNLTLLMATLVLFSTRWQQTPWRRTERIAKFAVFCVTLTAFILTQTRSGWVAVPVFCVVGAILLNRQFRLGRILALALLSLVAVSAIFMANTELRERTVLGYEEVITCRGDQATTDNSLCIRLQLWRAAGDMLSQRPLAGIGDSRHFGTTMQQESLPKGLVSEHVAAEWGEPHNDLLLALASYGIPGGLALLATFLGPAWIFARRLSFDRTANQRTAAAMGLVVCFGIMLFGLSETMLHSMRTVGFYATTIGLLLRLSDGPP